MNLTNKKIFDNIYEKGDWKRGQSLSGPGSDLEYTTALRRELPGLLRSKGIERLCDAGCGDMTWMIEVLKEVPGVHYIGLDISEKVIELNRKNYPYSFFNIDITEDILPKCDMILVKDVFLHLSLEDIKKALANIGKAKIKYVLATSYINNTINLEKTTNGMARPINLQLDPFFLPNPIQMIEENNGGRWGKMEFSKRICLWDMGI